MAKKVDHTHGDTGSKPSDSLNFQRGDKPDPEVFDWFWTEVPAAINDHADTLNNLDEEAQDAVAAALTGGSNVTISYDDANDTITVNASATDTQLTNEEVEDIVGALVTGGTNITVNYDDANNTLTINGVSDSDIQTVIDGEVDNAASSLAGLDDAVSNHDHSSDSKGSLIPDDGLVEDYVTSTESSSYTDEQAQDAVAAALTGENNVSISYDDVNDTLTISLASSISTSTVEATDTLTDPSGVDHTGEIADSADVSSIQTSSDVDHDSTTGGTDPDAHHTKPTTTQNTEKAGDNELTGSKTDDTSINEEGGSTSGTIQCNGQETFDGQLLTGTADTRNAGSDYDYTIDFTIKVDGNTIATTSVTSTSQSFSVAVTHPVESATDYTVDYTITNNAPQGDTTDENKIDNVVYQVESNTVHVAKHDHSI